jgi:hypothetical protein
MNSGILPAALRDIRERVMRARPSDLAAYVATLRESAPHLFANAVATPGSIGIRVGAGSSKPPGSASREPLTLTAVAMMKDETARAKALPTLMEQERGRKR